MSVERRSELNGDFTEFLDPIFGGNFLEDHQELSQPSFPKTRLHFCFLGLQTFNKCTSLPPEEKPLYKPFILYCHFLPKYPVTCKFSRSFFQAQSSISLRKEAINSAGWPFWHHPFFTVKLQEAGKSDTFSIGRGEKRVEKSRRIQV